MRGKAFRVLAIALTAATLTSSPARAQSDPEQDTSNITSYNCIPAEGPDYSEVIPGYIGIFGCDNGYVYMLIGNAQDHTTKVSFETQQAYAAGCNRGCMTTVVSSPANEMRGDDGTILGVKFLFAWSSQICTFYLTQINGNGLECRWNGVTNGA